MTKYVVTTICTALNAKQANERLRSSRVLTTDFNVALTSAMLKMSVPMRSSSNRSRNGCRTSAKTRQAPAMMSIAPRQPVAVASSGPRKPASSSPAGTAVCLIEKTRGAYCTGEKRPSRCELAGVDTAEPPPAMMAESRNTIRPPSTMTPNPTASMTSEAWLTRIAP